MVDGVSGPPPREDPLDELVDGVRRGDRDAIAAVYLDVAPALRGFLRRRVTYGQLADDLVEQTFVELIEGGHRIRGDGRSLRAWLFRAARNDLHDHRKRAERRSDHELRATHTERLADPDPGPEEVVADEVTRAQVLAAMEELTPEQREVIELRVIAELSTAQVAEITGRSVGAVKVMQHRAVRALARHLAVHEEDHP